MPALANRLWELFAQQREAGVPREEAYLRSGYKQPKTDYALRLNSWQLDQNPRIIARRSEIRDEMISRFVVTPHTMIMQLEEAYRVAFEQRNPAAMTSAVMAKAKILGLDQPQKMLDEPAKKFENMTDEEIRFMWAQMLADIRAAKALLPAPKKVIEH